MKKQSIKSHLKPYSIFVKRKTTVNHAFASALAPTDTYDETLVDGALRVLGQDPDCDLACVYCGDKASTWDHLIGLVKDAELRGYGHQIGNLVPCCRDCNSSKGSKDWQYFTRCKINDENKRKEIELKLTTYLRQFARPVNIDQIKLEMPDEWFQYVDLRNQILELMKAADKVAQQIRNSRICYNGGSVEAE
jgi:hypothetical protein